MTLQETVAFELHEAWRRPRLQADGTYEPRWKKIKDENYISKLPKELPAYVRVNEAGEYEMDIANACYLQLSADWQAENSAAAEVVAKMIESGKEYTDLEAGDIIHNAWLERNSWAKDGELGVPFAQLPLEEQEKDLVQYHIAQQMAQAKQIQVYGDLDVATQRLEGAKARGQNVYVEFNGQKLYSLFDTVDTCYLKVCGSTKAEYEKAREAWLNDYKIRSEREKAEAQLKVPLWYERGKSMIFPEKWDNWKACVESRAEDLYHGWDLVNALEIMEALEQGKTIKEASAIFDEANHSGASASMVLKIVVNFSKRGVEFFRANCDWEITPETEAFLQKIEAENANLAKMQNVKAQNPETVTPKV